MSRPRSHPGTAANFFFLLFQNPDDVLCHRKRPVGVLGFQGGIYDFSADPGDLLFHPKVSVFEIDAFPFRAKQFASSQSCCQLHIVHLEYPTVSGISKEGCQLFNGQRFHLLAFQLRQDTSFCRVCCDKSLLLCQFHSRGNDLVDISHHFGTQALGLLFTLDPIYPAFFQQFLVKLL